MKLFTTVALALAAAVPTMASAATFSLNFETPWTFVEDISNYYSGGTSVNGSVGPNMGVTFTNFVGLSNDPSFTYYSNAPSPIGIATALTFAPTDTAFLNLASGVSNAIRFFYSSPSAVTGAVKAYSGINGTGTLLGTLNLSANITAPTNGDFAVYDTWSIATFGFAGVARSFDFTSSANIVGFDNIATVPEPATLLMLAAGGVAALAARRRRS